MICIDMVYAIMGDLYDIDVVDGSDRLIMWYITVSNIF